MQTFQIARAIPPFMVVQHQGSQIDGFLEGIENPEAGDDMLLILALHCRIPALGVD
ncbi:hypothetical protein SDC9_97700 [bioreactor metagenome]|uniref:Uncharacterized protein n=1 Tax=bioreactor metagenome TaxID=1076179 RepID=A0A645AMV2_9ZZZZ